MAGEFARKLAMFTATSNFSHIVADEKAEDHQLVTIGIYQYVQHLWPHASIIAAVRRMGSHACLYVTRGDCSSRNKRVLRCHV